MFLPYFIYMIMFHITLFQKDMDGYMSESNAEELLLGLGIPLDDHEKPMSSIAPGLKLRVTSFR